MRLRSGGLAACCFDAGCARGFAALFMWYTRGCAALCDILAAVPLLVCGFAALCDVLAVVPLVVSDGLLQLRRLGAVPLS